MASLTGRSMHRRCSHPTARSLHGSGGRDPRVSYVEELELYVITCTAYGPGGPCVFLAQTRATSRHSTTARSCCPRRQERHVVPRASAGSGCCSIVPSSWRVRRRTSISQSDDLTSWRHPERVMACRPRPVGGTRCASASVPRRSRRNRLAAPVPRRAPQVSGAIYRMGAALLDPKIPRVVRGRLNQLVVDHARHTSESATSPTWCSRVVSAPIPTAPSGCTTAPPTPRSRWATGALGRILALFSSPGLVGDGIGYRVAYERRAPASPSPPTVGGRCWCRHEHLDAIPGPLLLPVVRRPS